MIALSRVFRGECDSERILIIGQIFDTIMTKSRWRTFLTYGVFESIYFSTYIFIFTIIGLRV